LRKIGVLGTMGSASLIAVALLLAPALSAETANRGKARPAGESQVRPIGAFTPAVSDPRLAAALARRGRTLDGDFRFTPANASGERSRAVRVAIRARANTPAEAARGVIAAASSVPSSAIMPSSYNLGVSLGWRRFAISGDIAHSDAGVGLGARDSAEVGMSYRANRRLTGRVSVAAERAEGAQRIIGEDEAYSLDVGGAYSIARNIDVTAGARYRISRDNVDSLARDERRDSQAVYIGTAFRF
jgi:hypothetical protein